jgi:hypothetical protein
MLFVDSTYAYRVRINAVKIEGQIDAVKVRLIAVMKDEMFVVCTENRRQIKVFDISQMRELDSSRCTEPNLAKIEAGFKRVIGIIFHADIYWLAVSIVLYARAFKRSSEASDRVRYLHGAGNFHYSCGHEIAIKIIEKIMSKH